METDLRKESYEYMSLVWSGCVGRECSEEYVVPDAMPDVGAITEAEAVLTLRSKDTVTNGMQLSAVLTVTVVYTPEEGGALRSLELTLPADIRADAPGVDETCSAVVRLRARSVEARAINSRKIAVRGDVEADLRCYRRGVTEIAAGLAAEDAPAHILAGAAEVVEVTDVREKTFAVTDEYAFPAECAGTEEILTRRVEAITEDVQYVSGKAVFHGRIRSELLFSDPMSGAVSVGRYETEFSQIMEVGDAGMETLPEITLFFTGVYFDLPERDRESGRIAAELHLGAQCICREKKEIHYIADIYSNRTELVPATETLRCVREIRPASVRQTVAGRAEPITGEAEILRTAASVGGITLEDGTVKTTVNIRVLYRRTDGQYDCARCRLAADFTMPELKEEAKLENITVTVSDVYSVGSGGDVRAVLQMDASVIEPGTLVCVSAVDEDAAAWEARERTPSLTLLRVPAQADLWPIARQYHSTVEAIEAVNAGRKEGLLLVPKGR